MEKELAKELEAKRLRIAQKVERFIELIGTQENVSNAELLGYFQATIIDSMHKASMAAMYAAAQQHKAKKNGSGIIAAPPGMKLDDFPKG